MGAVVILAWLNIVDAGVITAGSVAPLPVLLGGLKGETQNHLWALCVGCSVLGDCLHFLARRLLRRPAGPPQEDKMFPEVPSADTAVPHRRAASTT